MPELPPTRPTAPAPHGAITPSASSSRVAAPGQARAAGRALGPRAEEGTR